MTNEPTADELRELDAWIAEYVMKLKRVKFPTQIEHGCFFYDKRHLRVMVHETQHRITEFQPTENRGDAMSVLEKCLSKEKHTECVYFGKGVSGYIVGHEVQPIEIVAPTLPLAICRFAKALFGEA